MRIFIGGTGRSGTTILGRILGASPEVLLFLEPRFISDSGGIYDYVTGACGAEDLRRRMLESFRARLANGVRPAMDGFWNSFYSAGLIQEILERHLAGKDRLADARAVIDDLFRAGMLAAGRTRWVEKTPHTVRRCDILWRIFPDMRYIHVFRDPRDIYCSVRNLFWGPNTPEEFVTWYRDIMTDALESSRNLPPDCYLALDLADLIAAPLAMTQRMLKFCNLPHDESSVARCAGEIDIDKCRNGRWKTELSKADGTFIATHSLPIYAQWRELGANSK